MSPSNLCATSTSGPGWLGEATLRTWESSPLLVDPGRYDHLTESVSSCSQPYSAGEQHEAPRLVTAKQTFKRLSSILRGGGGFPFTTAFRLGSSAIPHGSNPLAVDNSCKISKYC